MSRKIGDGIRDRLRPRPDAEPDLLASVLRIEMQCAGPSTRMSRKNGDRLFAPFRTRVAYVSAALAAEKPD